MEAVYQSIWKITSSSGLLKSHRSYRVLTGICTSVCLSVLEIGLSSFLTFNLKMEQQFLTDWKILMVPSPLIRYCGPSEILGLQFPGELPMQFFVVRSKSLDNEWCDCGAGLLGNVLELLELYQFLLSPAFFVLVTYFMWNDFNLIFFQIFLTTFHISYLIIKELFNKPALLRSIT